MSSMAYPNLDNPGTTTMTLFLICLIHSIPLFSKCLLSVGHISGTLYSAAEIIRGTTWPSLCLSHQLP